MRGEGASVREKRKVAMRFEAVGVITGRSYRNGDSILDNIISSDSTMA
jgi:hypothetical protein